MCKVRWDIYQTDERGVHQWQTLPLLLLMESDDSTEKVMRIQIDQVRGLLIHFPLPELRVALSVLRALYTVSKASFIREAIEEVEMMLRPKALPFVNYFHWCELCGRDLDEREANTMHYMSGDKDYWRHKTCPPLKDKRPN